MKTDFIDAELKRLEDEGLLVKIRSVGSPQGAWIDVDGKRVLNFCSNNYLGFANDPALVTAAVAGVKRWGVGPGAVRTIAGNADFHRELERKLADFKGVEATLSYQSGFCANLSVIPALVGRGDTIFSDELNHASIIDGARLSRAKIVRYEHRDAGSLKKALAAGYEGRALVVTDGVFSMDGDVAPLDEVVAVAERYGALVMVDDAHGEGVLGRGGRGIVDHFGLHGKVEVEMGTLSKAFGAMGGYVAGSASLVRFLEQKSRPFLFSSAQTAADVYACIRAVDTLAASTDRVERLWSNTKTFKSGMMKAGFDVGHSETPIVPVMLGDEKLTQAFSRRLFEEGVFGTAITYPTVPLGKARIRAMMSATLSEDDLALALDKFALVRQELLA